MARRWPRSPEPRGIDADWSARPRWRIRLGTEIALGPGKAELLETIERVGSISGAARALGMSYRRAWSLVETMNRCFLRPLVATSSHRRQGARLTADGKEVLRLYREAEAESRKAARAALLEIERRLGS